MQVLTSISMVLKRILDNIASDYEKLGESIHIKYSSEINYQDFLEGLRKRNITNEINQSAVFPLLAWNRSTLKIDSDITRRGRVPSTGVLGRFNSSEVSYEGYDVLMGVLDLRFLYAAKNIGDIESFEILYNSENLISNIKDMSIDFSEIKDDLSTQNYKIEWRELDDSISVNKDDNFYVSVQGGVTIRGPFIIATPETPAIEQINAVVQNYNDIIFDSIIIT